MRLEGILYINVHKILKKQKEQMHESKLWNDFNKVQISISPDNIIIFFTA